MGMEQIVIQKFLRALDETDLRRAEAMDEAIRVCSDGKYTTFQDLIDNYLRDLQNYGGDNRSTYWNIDDQTKVFLEKYCGIVLDNEDTGSIIGTDAGGPVVKTATSIVPNAAGAAVYPTEKQTTINGLTFVWPDKDSLSYTEQAVVARLNSWWAQNALDLIEQSYGLSFKEVGTSVKTIEVHCYNDATNTLAYVGSTYDSYTGVTEKLTLNINMHYYDSIVMDNRDGLSSDTSAFLDRTLAHELTHAVMAANITNFAALPLYVKEGLAELVHGIDDERKSEIIDLAQKDFFDDEEKMLSYSTNTNYNYGSHSYAMGYMIFRYLAKQVANDYLLPSDVIFNNHKAVLSANFSGIFNADSYQKYEIDSVDAKSVTNDLIINSDDHVTAIWAGKKHTTITLGNSGNTVYDQAGTQTDVTAGSGKDVFRFADHKGKLNISGFDTTKDILKLENSTVGGYTSENNDIIITSGSGNIRLNGAAGKRFILNARDNVDYAVWFGRKDKANTYAYENGGTYYGYANTQDTLKVTAGTTINLGESRFHDIDVVDAKTSKASVNLTGTNHKVDLYGGAGNDTLTAGSQGGILSGGAGNDRLTAGAGKDYIYVAGNDGSDIVTGFNAGQDVLKLVDSTVAGWSTSGDNLTVKTGNASVTLNGATGKRFIQNARDNNNYVVWYGHQDRANTYTYENGGNYYGYANTTDTLKINSSATVNLNEARFHYMDVADGRTAKSAVNLTGGNRKTDLYGGAGNDTLTAGSQGGILSGGAGNDRLTAGAGKDYIYVAGSDGSDIVTGFNAGQDVLKLVDSTVAGWSTSGDNLTVKTGNASVTLNGAAGKRFIQNARDNNNYVVWYGRQDRANTYTYENGGNYYGYAGTVDTLNVNTGAAINLGEGRFHHIDILDARKATAAVTFTADTTGSTLYGSTYSDNLYGSAGTTKINGGKGNDSIWGGKSKDIIYFGHGDGKDTVYNVNAADTVVFYDTDKVNDLVLSQHGDDLQIAFADSTDSMVIKSWKNSQWTNIQLADNQTYTIQKTLQIFNKNGQPVNTPEELVTIDKRSSKVSETLDGGSKKANLYGGAGNDILIAGAQGGILSGGAGNDTLLSGAGRDSVYIAGNDGHDTVIGFDAGQDVLKLVDSTVAGWSTSGNDLTVKTGNASVTLNGAAGKRFIQNARDNNNYVVWYGYQDRANTYTYEAGGNYYGYANTTDTLKINSGATVNLNEARFHYMDLADGRAAKSAVNLTGGNRKTDLYGGAGNDTLTAGSQGGILSGGAGNDRLTAGVGKDYIYVAGNDGSDIVTGFNAGQDVLKLVDSTVAGWSTSGDNLTVKTGNASVTLNGAAGKRFIQNARDNNNYVVWYGRQDRANTYTYENGGNYYGYANTTDTLKINSSATVNLNEARFHYMDVADGRTAKSALNLTGGNRKTDLYGGAGNDTLTAGSQGGILSGGAGNDWLAAGAGKDYIYVAGGDGRDTVIGFNTNQDVLKLVDSTVSGWSAMGDNLTVKTGNASVTLEGAAGKRFIQNARDNNNYVVWYGRQDRANTYTYENGGNYYGYANIEDTLKVNFGTTINLNEGRFHYIDNVDARSAAGAVTVTAANNSTIYGSNYADKLYGSSSNTTFYSGKGNDTIFAGSGTDTIYFDKGDGHDVIYNLDSKDQIIFGNRSSVPGKLEFTKYGNDLSIRIVETSDTILLKNWNMNNSPSLYYSGDPRRFHLGLSMEGSLRLMDEIGNVQDSKISIIENPRFYNYTQAGGSQTLNDYKSGIDVIRFTNGSYDGYRISGDDVILSSGNNQIRVKNGAGKILSVWDKDGNRGSYLYEKSEFPNDYYVTSNDGTRITLGRNYGADSYRYDSLQVNDPVTVMNGTGTQENSNWYVNAMGTKPKTLIGGAGTANLSEYADGNITFYGGVGSDNFNVYLENDKTDIIWNYQKGKDTIKQNSSSMLRSYEVIGEDVILYGSNGKVIVKNTRPTDLDVYALSGQKTTYWLDGKLPQGIHYQNNKTKIVLDNTFTGNLYLSEYDETVSTVDASAVTSGYINLQGTMDKDNVIIGGERAAI